MAFVQTPQQQRLARFRQQAVALHVRADELRQLRQRIENEGPQYVDEVLDTIDERVTELSTARGKIRRRVQWMVTGR